MGREPQVVSPELLIFRNMSGLSYEKKTNQIFLYASISCTFVILMGCLPTKTQFFMLKHKVHLF